MTLARAPKPSWDCIDTVLLDLDGTLLDLAFDNYFWLERIPTAYAAARGLTLEEAQARAPDVVDQAGWRRRFAGDNEEDGSTFDSTFAALVKASYTQIKMR